MAVFSQFDFTPCSNLSESVITATFTQILDKFHLGICIILPQFWNYFDCYLTQSVKAALVESISFCSQAMCWQRYPMCSSLLESRLMIKNRCIHARYGPRTKSSYGGCHQLSFPLPLVALVAPPLLPSNSSSSDSENNPLARSQVPRSLVGLPRRSSCYCQHVQ